MDRSTPNTAALARRDALGDLQPLKPAGSYTFDDLYRLGQVFHASGLFDDVKDAAQATVKILKGQEMGIPPTTAMSAFDLIQKKLFIKPWAIAAKINACGYGQYKVLRQDAEACTLAFAKRYPGQGWQACPPVTYTIEEARAHGLVGRSAHWKANPAHMLYQRAMGRGGAMYFPELLAGLEVPTDDTPVTVEQGQQQVIDLFGDQQGVRAARDASRNIMPQDTPQESPSTAKNTRVEKETAQSTPKEKSGVKESSDANQGYNPETGEIDELFDTEASAALDRDLADD